MKLKGNYMNNVHMRSGSGNSCVKAQKEDKPKPDRRTSYNERPRFKSIIHPEEHSPQENPLSIGKGVKKKNDKKDEMHKKLLELGIKLPKKTSKKKLISIFENINKR